VDDDNSTWNYGVTALGPEAIPVGRHGKPHVFNSLEHDFKDMEYTDTDHIL
jgi:hypothetical protein